MSKHNDNWFGIMKILHIQKWDVDGTLLWEDRNIRNLLHLEGEEFILRAAFSGGKNSVVIPENYYLGLDNRLNPLAANTMDDLIGEPTGGGYTRQSISSLNDFSVNLDSEHYIATSPIVAFNATSSAWGPVSNLFLTDKDDNTGSLISTAVLETAVSLEIGQQVTMRIGLLLKDCPTTV